jgi:RHS repeat-associated protein
MRTITDTERLTEMEDYENKSWVKHQGARVLKPNGTSTPTDFVWSYVERRDALNYTGNPVWTGKQHLMLNNVPQRKIDENTDWQGVDWSVTGVNGAQQPTIMIRYLNGGGVSDVRTWQEFSYDNGMRMTDQKYLYALNGAGLSAPTFTLSNQVYNYKDQLIEKNIGYRGTNNALQSIDYQYNTRGWLTGINTVNVYGGQSILTPSGMGSGAISGLAVTPFIGEALAQGMSKEQYLQGKAFLMPPVADNNVDLFSQVLTYSNPDSRTQANPQYNGNISSTTWHVAGRAKQAYGFAYDDLNRLTNAQYFDVTDSYSNGWNSNFSDDNKFNEQLTYDLRGNITTLKRNGLNSNGWTGNNFVAGTYGRIDNLTYAYNTKNQLLSVNEASLPTRGFKTNPNATGNQYDYDANGNLISDKNKYITSIEYNYLNLPIKVVIDNPTDAVNSGSIEFVYDATGTKLRKTVKYSNGSVKETWDYVNGVEYKNQILQRVAHSEGAVVRNDYGQYQHEYVLRDHLGNTRVTFTDGVNKGEPYWDWSNYSYIQPDNTGYDDGVVTEADIKHINHTYPFGMAMEGNWNNAGSANNNKYLYNGKQWNDDFGMGWYDYGARFYDPAIARWNAIDPLAEKYKRWSPYNYCLDNPIKFIDPNGMEVKEMADRTRYTGADAVALFKELQKNSNKQDDPEPQGGVIVNDMGAILSNTTVKGNRDPMVYMKKWGKYTLLGSMGTSVDISQIYRNILTTNVGIARGWGFGSRLYNFNEQVRNHGTWDYKNNTSTIFGLANLRFDNKTQFNFFNQTMTAQDIGNHHYGAVGKATGFGDEFLLQMAGAAQISAKTSRPEWRIYAEEPYTTPDGLISQGTLLPPYGDDPADQIRIKQGFALYQSWFNSEKP